MTDDEFRTKVQRLLNDGMSYDQIAEMLAESFELDVNDMREEILSIMEA